MSFQRSSSTTCMSWINGNCSKGEDCRDLHWWVDTNKVSCFSYHFLLRF